MVEVRNRCRQVGPLQVQMAQGTEDNPKRENAYRVIEMQVYNVQWNLATLGTFKTGCFSKVAGFQRPRFHCIHIIRCRYTYTRTCTS